MPLWTVWNHNKHFYFLTFSIQNDSLIKREIIHRLITNKNNCAALKDTVQVFYLVSISWWLGANALVSQPTSQPGSLTDAIQCLFPSLTVTSSPVWVISLSFSLSVVPALLFRNIMQQVKSLGIWSILTQRTLPRAKEKNFWRFNFCSWPSYLDPPFISRCRVAWWSQV